jgi:hypothetical protein
MMLSPFFLKIDSHDAWITAGTQSAFTKTDSKSMGNVPQLLSMQEDEECHWKKSLLRLSVYSFFFVRGKRCNGCTPSHIALSRLG